MQAPVVKEFGRDLIIEEVGADPGRRSGTGQAGHWVRSTPFDEMKHGKIDGRVVISY